MADLHNVDWTSIPAPADDGAADHLAGTALPAVGLPASSGVTVDLSTIRGRLVLYAYPMTGRPDVALPDGWDLIPGARGCTPQACAFRDHFAELRERGVDHLFGMSAQSPAEQAEAATRLHLPFALLSDEHLRFADALRLPRFEAAGRTLLKRLTMVCEDGIIQRVLYPVFPPDRNPEMLLELLSQKG